MANKPRTPERRSVALRLLASMERSEGKPRAAALLDETVVELDALRAEVRALKRPAPQGEAAARRKAIARDLTYYGDLAEVFRAMKATGNWTRKSVEYVLGQVWFE